MSFSRAKVHKKELHKDWKLSSRGKVISREMRFKNFLENVKFVNRVAKLAEKEGHHPDLNIHGWNKLTITLSTHAINGLSMNDFILAAKIDQL